MKPYQKVFFVMADRETWRPVVGFPKYEVSTLGDVRNVRTGSVLKPVMDGKRRCRVNLFGESKAMVTVARAVAEAFLPDWDPNLKVKHRDGNASNNAVSNLVMTTNKEMNTNRTFENGNPRKRVKIECYKDGVYIRTYDSIDDAVKATGAAQQNISKVLTGKRQKCGGFGWRYAQSAVIPGEEWKPFEANVDVSSEGRVSRPSFAGGYARDSSELPVDDYGYPIFGIGSNNVKLHIAVAKAFIENPDGKPEVNHKDGDKMNARVDNLEWATSPENNRHAHETGLNKTKKGVDRIDESGRVIARYSSIAEASRATGQHESKIRDHAKGNRAVPEWRRP